ncbi:MAG: ricin-type beta-trefoil lectin domain protein [Anaerolineae bacterium]
MHEDGSHIDERSRARLAGMPRARGRWRVVGAVVLALTILLLSPSIVNALMGGDGLMWTVWQSAPVKLVVCWENPDDANPLPGEVDQTSGALRREWARLALKNSWEREARVLFTGWQECQDEANAEPPPYTLGPRRPGTADENIKIYITADSGGQNPGHGSWGDYMQSGVRLNLHCGSRECIEFLTIHEFGHVLGLYHGEERSDWPTDIPGCLPQTHEESWPWWPVPGERLWGAPDRYSIMAYCSNRPTELSSRDVAGIQRAYERHLPGTLLSLPGSLCLSAHADAANGARAFGWECDEALDDQEWHYNIATQALYIQSPTDPSETPRCLDVDTVSGSIVQTWDCLQGSNQQWRFEDVVVRGFGGLCLTRSGMGTSALTMQPCSTTYTVFLPLVLRASGGGAASTAPASAASTSAATGFVTQRWRIEPSEIPGAVRVRTLTGDLCLTQSGGSGSDALAAPCTAGTTSDIQDFLLGTGGQIGLISFTHGALCLDVEDVLDRAYTLGDGGPVAGQRVRFIECSTDTQLTQNWSFSGHVVSGGKCLALGGISTQNGAGALVMPCTTAAGQKWDYQW